MDTEYLVGNGADRFRVHVSELIDKFAEHAVWTAHGYLAQATELGEISKGHTHVYFGHL